MDHADHVRLLRRGVEARQDVIASGMSGTRDVIADWADLGAGTGAFTLALADLLPAGSTIHAVDRDGEALDELGVRLARLAKRTGRPHHLAPHIADFTRDLGLPSLDGVVMANSLHFVKDKAPVLARVRALLRPGAPLLLVEYDSDQGNQWVPYPLTFESWRVLAVVHGFSEPMLLESHPSRFLRRIYSAAAHRI